MAIFVTDFLLVLQLRTDRKMAEKKAHIKLVVAIPYAIPYPVREPIKAYIALE